MNVTPYTDNLEAYLTADEIIDYNNTRIAELAGELYQKSGGETEYVKLAFEYVRDNVLHSTSICSDTLTCSASEVLEAQHGICFARSHLLAALLRNKSVPAGFCYQRIILDDDTAPVLVYHGLNAAYIKELEKWIRLDPGVTLYFSLEDERLVRPVRPEKGEEDGFIVYPDPDLKIVEKFRKYKTRTQLWENLPTELAYNEKR